MGEQYDGHWQESLSEESRRMIQDASFQAWKGFFDELTTTPKKLTDEQQARLELGRRVRLIAVDLELSGQEDDARVLMLAAESLMNQ